MRTTTPAEPDTIRGLRQAARYTGVDEERAVAAARALAAELERALDDVASVLTDQLFDGLRLEDAIATLPRRERSRGYPRL